MRARLSCIAPGGRRQRRLGATPGGALLATVAYPKLHTLIYSHIGQLTLVDRFVMSTHAMVLARRAGGRA